MVDDEGLELLLCVGFVDVEDVFLLPLLLLEGFDELTRSLVLGFELLLEGLELLVFWVCLDELEWSSSFCFFVAAS